MLNGWSRKGNKAYSVNTVRLLRLSHLSTNQKVDGFLPDSSTLHIIISVRKTVNVCEYNLQLKALTQLE